MICERGIAVLNDLNDVDLRIVLQVGALARSPLQFGSVKVPGFPYML